MIDRKLAETAKKKIRDNAHHLVEKAFVVSAEGGVTKFVIYAVLQTIKFACIKILEQMFKKSRERAAIEEAKILSPDFSQQRDI